MLLPAFTSPPFSYPPSGFSSLQGGNCLSPFSRTHSPVFAAVNRGEPGAFSPSSLLLLFLLCCHDTSCLPPCSFPLCSLLFLPHLLSHTLGQEAHQEGGRREGKVKYARNMGRLREWMRG